MSSVDKFEATNKFTVSHEKYETDSKKSNALI